MNKRLTKEYILKGYTRPTASNIGTIAKSLQHYRNGKKSMNKGFQ